MKKSGMRVVGSTTRVWGSPAAGGECENSDLMELWEKQSLNPARFGSPEPPHHGAGHSQLPTIPGVGKPGARSRLLLQSLSGEKRGSENASLKT